MAHWSHISPTLFDPGDLSTFEVCLMVSLALNVT